MPSETLEASECEGYRLTCVKRTYAGIPQPWVGVENQVRVESDCQQVEKQVDKRRQQAEKAFRQQAQTDFSCAEDALTQAQILATAWRYHTLDALQVVEHRHYAHPGRPKKGATPTQITYRVTAQVVADKKAIEHAKRKAGRFILATNGVDDPEVTAESILSDYKGQQASEMCQPQYTHKHLSNYAQTA